jgi:2-polyprenyl-3-methyl-5-hydroxy-6-metoxy-1,4-benzoquinol methylase
MIGSAAMDFRRVLLLFVFFGALCQSQNPQYSFYPEFRSWARQLRISERALDIGQIIDRYAAKLRTQGVSDSEIQRRINLLKNSRNELEDDFWNRFFTEGKANYNRAPNAFLVEIVEGRKPGTALDYGMGEGRNALYLAKKGWRVSGFDPAAKAVAMAQRRAKELGLTLDTKTVRDTDYDFGHERFDVVLFSWMMPDRANVARTIDALKPGGLVVMECGANWVGRNEMLKLFDALQIVRYEIVVAPSDFFDRREMEVLRLVARKPEQASEATGS